MTTSYFYSYIETSSYQTTYTITIKARQNKYSLTGEWWESNDGNNWYKVTSNDGRESTFCPSGWGGCYTHFCPAGTCCSGYNAGSVQMNPNVWAVASSLKAGTTSIVALDRFGVSLICQGWNLIQKAVPVILYIRSNESVTASGINGYSISGVSMSLYESCWGEPFCLLYVTEWGRTYKLQAIELVDWNTGEVYSSVNQTSVTFNINANTIVRFKYVLVDSWSRSWTVILPPKTPEPTPEECQRILNDPSKVGSRDWCWCAWIYDPEAARKHCNPIDACLEVDVYPCCSGDERFACLDSWSGNGGENCVRFTEEEARRGITKEISVGWSASWGLKPGWTLADIGKAGSANCDVSSLSGNSASGNCKIDARAQARYWTQVIVIFKKTQ